MIQGSRIALSVSNLEIRRQKGGALVSALNFELFEGEILALVGRSGVGKSSVLNAIAGFVPLVGQRQKSPWNWFDGKDELQYSGEIAVGGLPIDGTEPENRRAVGMVMQGGVVYEHLTVMQNVAFPLRAAGVRDRSKLRERARRLIGEAGLFLDLQGGALDEALGKKAVSLSGGERQRVALARALAKDPSVFLLDEAFANLDPLLRLDLFQMFTELILGQPRCAVVVTHDLSDLAKVQRVILLGPVGEGPSHWSYRRNNDSSWQLEGDHSGGSHYWEAWHARITGSHGTRADR